MKEWGEWEEKGVFSLSVAHQEFRRNIRKVFRGTSLINLRVVLEEQKNSWGEVLVVMT